jgi:histidinol dehydrogenase
MLSQAEHDVLAMCVCLALDGSGPAIADELERQLAKLPEARRATASESVKAFGTIVACDSLAQAANLANRIAPEHLELLVRDPAALLPSIRNAAAVFVGPWSPEPIGDYLAGPSHTLPTGGTARMWSGIGADTFMRRSSLINLGKADFDRLAAAGIALARAEGLEAHARSIEARLPK